MNSYLLIVKVLTVLTIGDGDPNAFGFFSKLAQVLRNFKASMATIIVPLGALAAGICAVRIMIADNKQEVASAKSWLIGIVIGVLLFYFAGELIQAFADLASAS